jgi:hypothetical protein
VAWGDIFNVALPLLARQLNNCLVKGSHQKKKKLLKGRVQYKTIFNRKPEFTGTDGKAFVFSSSKCFGEKPEQFQFFTVLLFPAWLDTDYLLPSSAQALALAQLS